MSLATLERTMAANARILFCNPKLRIKDILEWGCGEIKPHEGEVTAYVSDPGVWVTIKAELDRRKPEGGASKRGKAGRGKV